MTDNNSNSSNNQGSNDQQSSQIASKPIVNIEIPNPPRLITDGFEPTMEIKKDK